MTRSITMLTTNSISKAYRVKRADRHRNGIVAGLLSYLDAGMLFQQQVHVEEVVRRRCVRPRCQLLVSQSLFAQFLRLFFLQQLRMLLTAFASGVCSKTRHN